MCISATVLAVASLATAAVGTAVSISAANANAAAEQERLKIQQEQYRQELEMQRLQALEAENERVKAFRLQRAANLAAMAASGVGENMSFLQGIAPAEEQALRVDLRNIRLGQMGNENRMAAEIRVNRLNSAVTNYNRKVQIAGSLIDFAGSAVNAGQYASNYKSGSVGIDQNALNRTYASNTAYVKSQIGAK